MGQCLRMRCRLWHVSRQRDFAWQVVRRAARLVDHYFGEGWHKTVIACRQHSEHEVHYTDVGANADCEHGDDAIVVDPVHNLVAPSGGINRADKAIYAVFFKDFLLTNDNNILTAAGVMPSILKA